MKRPDRTKSLFDLTGKVAVVVGGGGLIGSAVSRGLAAHGARVVVADKSFPRDGLMDAIPGARFMRCDVAKTKPMANVLKDIVTRIGGIDVLINCAYPRTHDWGDACEKIHPDSWKQNLDSHLGGYFFSSRAAAELMRKRGKGSIVNFASIYGLVAPDFGLYAGTDLTMPAAYSAIKGGIIAFTKYLATYYAPHGIRANVISPGGVENGQPPALVRRYSQKTPLGRMARPEDMIGAVIYLASDASAYVTGSNIVVDGGWTAW